MNESWKLSEIGVDERSLWGGYKEKTKKAIRLCLRLMQAMDGGMEIKITWDSRDNNTTKYRLTGEVKCSTYSNMKRLEKK